MGLTEAIAAMRGVFTQARRVASVSIVFLTITPSTTSAANAGGEGAVIFAAASLKSALDEIEVLYEDRTSTDVVLSYAGSSALARQIEQGAPADVFISANMTWMDRLEDKGLIVEGTRRALLGNRLVLIGNAQMAGANGGVPAKDPDFERLLGGGRIAMALVDAVPAGVYGKEALTSLGLWETASQRVVQTDNVRAALALVALGAAPLGVTYASDAVADPRVSVLATFPEETHTPIEYPAAVLSAGKGDAADDFLSFLSEPEALNVFEANGFTVLGEE
ncbi:molybdate ABC transporter substrate-binding protein [Celeribacter litoreus]|uniref:molybdate ABC transporter substrate-binding protein n=1 Tax=Celeribacter litoreus TaxID=2876714 RepID=UPI001CCED776|nr:molybdate ABC transporter substrate-binding protein [Celeribacter litoreus]MCA0042906.1 molybdate ABC transporter substrate-binding protein [Celeribacter litoreus]